MVVPIIVAGARVAATRTGASRAAYSSTGRASVTGVRNGASRQTSQDTMGVRTNLREAPRGYARQSVRQVKRIAVKKFKTKAQEVFGDDFDIDEFLDEINTIMHLEEIASTEVKKPEFPIVMFKIALFLDFANIADFSGIGYFVMLIVKIIFGIILWFWFLGKLSGLFRGGSKYIAKKIKRLLVRHAAKRFIFISLANLIPVISILASNAFFVFLVHNRMNKIAQMYILLVESASKQLMIIKRNNR